MIIWGTLTYFNHRILNLWYDSVMLIPLYQYKSIDFNQLFLRKPFLNCTNLHSTFCQVSISNNKSIYITVQHLFNRWNDFHYIMSLCMCILKLINRYGYAIGRLTCQLSQSKIRNIVHVMSFWSQIWPAYKFLKLK